MNIKDVKLPEGWSDADDMLEAMLTIQRGHEEAYAPIESRYHPRGATTQDGTRLVLDLNNPADQHVMRENLYHVIEELCEAGNCLRMKDWSQTPILTDIDHFDEELSDALHFLLRIFVRRGFSPENVFRLYLLKTEVNRFRRESRY